MKCLTDNQIILYLTVYGLTDIQKKIMDQHFTECDECNKRKKIYAVKLGKVLSDNRLECLTVEENIVDFFLGDVDTYLHKKIEQHLQSCETCKYLFEKINQSPAPENYFQKIYSQFSKLPQVAPSFLGSHPRGTKKITHDQGDIILNVGCKKKEIKLFSTDNVELDSQKSDENGIVIFKDFIGGEYQVQLEGFEIIDIKYPKPS